MSQECKVLPADCDHEIPYANPTLRTNTIDTPSPYQLRKLAYVYSGLFHAGRSEANKHGGQVSIHHSEPVSH